MDRRAAVCALSLLVAGTVPLWVCAAHAALGSDAASVVLDGAEMHGVVSTVSFGLYDRRQIAAGPGMRLCEFLDRDGVVFAVSWTGPALPDLRRLLGTHYAEYRAALATLNHPGLQRFVRVATPELVVESGGHLRAYAGRAYVPALIPAGVPPAELR